jgi:hypothetical protein
VRGGAAGRVAALWWRVPVWLRWAAVAVGTLGAGMVMDLATPRPHGVSVPYMVVVVVVWELVSEAERRHRLSRAGAADRGRVVVVTAADLRPVAAGWRWAGGPVVRRLGWRWE